MKKKANKPRVSKLSKTVLLVSAIILVLSSIQSYTAYNKSMQNMEEVNKTLHVEVIRLTAEDGASLKAVYMISANQANYTNHSIPFIILCHAMMKEYLQLTDFGQCLIDQGYAVLLPESRGHGSSPSPSTLAEKEPYDILIYLDYIENNYPAINVSASGIYGPSMGGLYATSAYVLESYGRGRFKALVEACGPTNISREVDFLTNNPEAVGEIDLLENIPEKNPIDRVNSTFPKNIQIFHDKNDMIVDYQCSVDLYNKINPEGNRADVNFSTVVGTGFGHILFDIPEVILQSIHWFNLYILGKNTTFSEIAISENPLDISTSKIFMRYLLIGSFTFGIFLSSLIYVLHPNSSNNEETNDKQNEEQEEKMQSRIIENQGGAESNHSFLWIGIYLLVWFLPHRLKIEFQTFFLNELLIGGIGTFLVIIMFVLWNARIPSKYKKIKNTLRNSLYIQRGIIWIIAISLGMGIYLGIGGSANVENSMLMNGARQSIWVWLAMLYNALQLILNIIFIRFIFPIMKPNWKIRLREIILVGLLYGLGIYLYFIENRLALIYFGDNKIPLIGFISVVFGFVFVLYDIIIQISEKYVHSIIPASFFLAWLFPLIIGSTNFIYVMNN